MAEEEENEFLKNRIIRKLAMRFEELSFDSSFYETAKAHLKIIADYFRNHAYQDANTGANIGHKDIKFIVAKFFWLKHCMYPRNKKFILEEDPLVPIVYLENKRLKEARRNAFSSVLSFNDILYLRVSDAMPDEYELHVISFIPAESKFKIKLDDLNIYVFLRKTPEELLVLGGELEEFDLIRAVPSEMVDEDGIKCYVTVISCNTVTLGRVSENDAFVPDILSERNCSSYKEALDIIAPFRYPNVRLMENLVYTIGIDPHEWNSYSQEWNAKLYSPDSHGDACLCEAEKWTSNDLVKEAEELYQSKETEMAFKLLDRASNLCYTNPSIYEARSKMYYETEDYVKAAMDFELALYLNPDTKVKELYSKFLFLCARHYQKNVKNYKTAATILCACMTLSEKDNELFLRCLRRIKKRMPEVKVPERFADVFSQVKIEEKKAHKKSPSDDSLADLIKKQEKIKHKLQMSKKINHKSVINEKKV